jgi:hypothetical protein
MAEELLPLGEAVRSLRAQIVEAAAIGSNDPLRFELGPIELEFSVVATREGSGGGKIEFKVWGIGATVEGSGTIASERTHKVKFTLSPKSEGGGTVDIHRKDEGP